MTIILSIISLFIFLFYLYFCAYEDWKTCYVQRWKHLIGLSASILMIIAFHNISFHTLKYILLYLIFYFVLGILKVYGMADGFVFMNMTLFLSSLFGIYSIFITIIIQIISCFLSLIFRLIRKLFKIKTNLSFIPYITFTFTIFIIIFFIIK